MTSHICASALGHMLGVISLLLSRISAGEVLQAPSVFARHVSLFRSFLVVEFGSLPDRGRFWRPSVLKCCIQIPVQSRHHIRHAAASFILRPLPHTVFAARIRTPTL